MVRITLLAGCALVGLVCAYTWQHSLKWTGLIQRTSAAPILLWLLLVALRLRTLPR